MVSESERIKGKYSVIELSKVLKWKKKKKRLFKHYNSNKIQFNNSLFPKELSISSKLVFFLFRGHQRNLFWFLKISCFNSYLLPFVSSSVYLHLFIFTPWLCQLVLCPIIFLMNQYFHSLIKLLCFLFFT